jgi:hypothetical protein
MAPWLTTRGPKRATVKLQDVFESVWLPEPSPFRFFPIFARKEAIAMNSVSVLFSYMAPQPFLPLTSVVAVVVGVALMTGRSAFKLIARWARLATVRKTQNQRVIGPHFQPGGRRADVVHTRHSMP